MPELIIAQHHEQVYAVWEQRGMRSLKVAHVDFHCDMRGLLIDRPRGRAIFKSHRESTFIDPGNFLSHAIMNGIVTDLRWVHGPQSGRRFDTGSVVGYETDFMTPWHRFKHNRSDSKEVSLNYLECLLSDWEGLRPGEQLDLDWDALASVEFDQAHKEALILQFLDRDLGAIPEIAFLTYSPGYSDPDRLLFEEFAQRLAHKFNATIARLPHAELNTEGERLGALRGLAREVLPEQMLEFKRDMAKRWRPLDAAHDLDFYAPSR